LKRKDQMRFLEKLGIDPTYVTEVQIVLKPGEHAKVYIERLLIKEELDIINTIKKEEGVS